MLINVGWGKKDSKKKINSISCKKLNKIIRNISFLDYKFKKQDFYEAMIKENLSENSNYEMQHSKKNEEREGPKKRGTNTFKKFTHQRKTKNIKRMNLPTNGSPDFKQKMLWSWLLKN